MDLFTQVVYYETVKASAKDKKYIRLLLSPTCDLWTYDLDSLFIHILLTEINTSFSVSFSITSCKCRERQHIQKKCFALCPGRDQ